VRNEREGMGGWRKRIRPIWSHQGFIIKDLRRETTPSLQVQVSQEETKELSLT
jgi:hypothetical protein